jgi:hypothetical protein
MENTFLIMWCAEGLETIVPIDMQQINEEYGKAVMARLSDDEEDVPYSQRMSDTLRAMELRAQVNGQRNYEIYSLRTSPDITEDILCGLFDDNPQAIVDLIRSHGVRILGSGRGTDRPVIF